MSHFNSLRLTRSDLVEPYNDALSSAMAAQNDEGLTVYSFDVNEVLEDIMSNPEEIGIASLTGQACDDCGGGTRPNPVLIAENPNEFLYWDQAVHFTAPVHEVIGMKASLAVPEPSSGLLMSLGLAMLMRRVGRR